MKDYKPVITSLVEHMRNHDIDITLVDDGGDEYDITESTTAERIAEIVCSVDDSHIIFQHKDGTHGFVLIVLGNEAVETPADYAPADWEPIEEAVNDFTAQWENEEVPTMEETV